MMPSGALTRVKRSLAPSLAVLVLFMVSGVARQAAVATATPPATPSATGSPGCDQLPAYFAAANELTASNEGLAILETVDFDVPALTDAQAAEVVASLDALLASWDGLSPPSAARPWHAAKRDLFAWYREMADAANRSHLDHQRLINGDKTIVPALGRATVLGQQACGVEPWNAALATAAATPAP